MPSFRMVLATGSNLKGLGGREGGCKMIKEQSIIVKDTTTSALQQHIYPL